MDATQWGDLMGNDLAGQPHPSWYKETFYESREEERCEIISPPLTPVAVLNSS